MKYLTALVQSIFPPLRAFWESRRTAYYLSVALVVTFGLSMGLALVNHWHLLEMPGLLGRCHFLQAVEVSFTLLLFFEMVSLVFVIPDSIANSIGKQIEILSLILLRSSFKEFSHYHFERPLQSQLESVYKMVSDGGGALLVFLLLSLYYGVQRHRAITQQGDQAGFVQLKQFISLLVLVALLLLIGQDVYQALRTGHWVQSIDRFYLLLIYADVLFLLVAFRYTLHYPDIFRYSAFVLVTVFIRFSLLAPVYYNALLGVFSVMFAIAVVYFHTVFTDGRLAYIARRQAPPAAAGETAAPPAVGAPPTPRG
ncbi:hypothetical protein CDA63_18305 [Hymenobacter amundsenii]|uniref:Uncharacterized protein n=1 Tax=Hymenobacter amundsenii TaxID=2006685 RepID=A0A246FGJ5_9BACT|nr:hypothetical protein [Hymenobacter amundsenii]OWP61646.1 hypothetical protein CDA63_18305 [Hymenobacter amundsenii]